MTEELNQALDNTETVYRNVVEIANKIVANATSEIDVLIKEAMDNVDNLTTEAIRTLLMKLSLLSFTFSDIKEKSALKAECAETLRKEAYAMAFNSSEGSVAAKDNQATIIISKETMVESIYNMVASLFKTKADEVHRVVDALKSVLMSRMAEAKLTATMYEGEGQ